MVSKTIVFLGILLATVLLITSEVTARDLVETSRETTTEQTNRVEDAKYGGEGHPGGRFGGNRGRGLGGGPGPGGEYGEGKLVGSIWDNGGGDWSCCDK